MTSRPAAREVQGLVLLLVALAFQAILLLPETRINQASLNDLVLHLTLSERLGEAVARGEPFLDPWVAEWSLGYPVWRSYQPLPHILGAVTLATFRGLASNEAIFAFLHYLLVVTLPVSLYLGGRMLGLVPRAAGLAALLAFAPSAAGDPDRYGLGYGAYVWRGSGLFTQIVALHLLALALGLTARALDRGGKRPLAALLLACTALSHIVFGYVAFASAGLFAVVGAKGARSSRLVRLATVVLPALLLLVWFVVPLFLSRDAVNHSRWEDAHKWDSHGAPKLLADLASGAMLDSGRAPALTLLVLLGALAALASWKDPLSRRLLALASLWLCLYFGRATWGHLLRLVFIPADLHLHRFQAAFELAALWLAAHGVERLVSAAFARRRALGAALVVLVAAAVGVIAADRKTYLEWNQRWGDENLAGWTSDRADIDAAIADLRRILAVRPGRVSAGKAAEWGKQFRIGSTPAYAFLARAHLDSPSFLYHSMSKTSDVMVLRDESNRSHDVAFGIRAYLAPADRPMPAHLARRATHGRFAVYESSPEGYFGIVDVAGRYTGPADTAYEPSTTWLASDQLGHGVVAALDPAAPFGPAFGRWQALPPRPAENLTPAGAVISETRDGETWRARLRLLRPSHALVKLTWFPDLVATVDGRPAPIHRVTPGFGAVPVPEGEHEVVVRYAPGRLKPALFALGLALFAGLAIAISRPASAPLEDRLARRLASLVAVRFTPRARATALLVLVALVALRPLFRGRLVGGHDAANYPPRLVEFDRVVGDRHLPPVWAPDLGNGFGQPLFEFAPPLLYVAALPLHRLGLGLADALQLGTALLHLAGAAAIYRLARRTRAPRMAGLAAAAAWLFAPYTALDLFVRTALAEAAAVAVAPIALLGLLRAIDRPSLARLTLGGIALALLPLAHNAVALLLFPAFGLVVAARALCRATRDSAGVRRLALRDLASGAGTIGLGLLLSAWFWFPALAEKPYVKTALLRQDFLDWRVHILSPGQLLATGWGHGLSIGGPGDGMYFGLGLFHLFLALAGLATALLLRGRVERAEGAAFALAAASGALLATTWSAPLWARVETLQYLAYPWRSLLLPGLFLPLLAIPLFDLAGRRLSFALLVVLAALNLGHTEPARYLTFDDEYYAGDAIATRGVNTTTREEYEPRWVETRPPYRPQPLAGLDAPVEARAQVTRSATREIWFRAERATRIEATLFYYPGWTAQIDGAAAPLAPLPGRGTIVLDAPAGEHTLRLTLTPTPARRGALVASLLTALALALGLAQPLAARLPRLSRG